MKARRKGINEPFMEIELVTFAGSTYVDDLYNVTVKDLEFEQEKTQQEPTSDHWQDVRERAAIAVLPQCLKIIQDVLWRGGSLTEENITKQAAVNAVEYADALVAKLKGE